MSNVHILSDPAPFAEKTTAYLTVRDREGRVLTNEQVLALPRFFPVSEGHQRLQREWRMRKHSFARFQKHLYRRYAKKPLEILDLGCGNGWMSLNLARRPGTNIWAVDVNLPELEQGARLAAASGLTNVRFVFADFLKNTIPEKKFDLVVLAASIQYFPDFAELYMAAKGVLKPGGIIHILDSPFYRTQEQCRAARAATGAYYASIGVPEMTNWYHHHLWQDVKKMGGKNLNSGMHTRILQHVHWLPPFPWVLFE
ncbi:MAG: class I SAM-dependent methyltransferase [Lewinellaceae bacterium]|nr:class I SAM-dependent methyltransferase [Saprospiraceae bacterium]MCB9330187.1 class I SAM-dependent methyltransferase [Lewinellaceae bacterium]